MEVAGGVEGAEHHAVGVAGKRRAVVEDDARLRVEVERAEAGDVDPAARSQGRFATLGLVGLEGLRAEAEQAQDHGAVGGVPLAGEGEAAMEARLDPGGRVGAGHAVGAGAQGFQEPGGGEHRAHGVGARWTDADLEDVEDAQEHPASGPGAGTGARTIIAVKS
jgi:hypothetical protein